MLADAAPAAMSINQQKQYGASSDNTKFDTCLKPGASKTHSDGNVQDMFQFLCTDETFSGELADLEGALQVKGLRGNVLLPKGIRNKACHGSCEPVWPQCAEDEQPVKLWHPLPVT